MMIAMSTNTIFNKTLRNRLFPSIATLFGLIRTSQLCQRQKEDKSGIFWRELCRLWLKVFKTKEERTSRNGRIIFNDE